MPAYLAERYPARVTIERFVEGLEMGRRVMESPAEEAVSSVYSGPSTAAVGQLNERVGIRSAALSRQSR